MKNIQVIDGGVNATFNIFQATDKEFASIFPGPGQDIEVIEEYLARVGEDEAAKTLSKIWQRPIYKHDIKGIHGTLHYDWKEKAKYLPKSRREIDRDPSGVNEYERALYARVRKLSRRRK
ncbi:MAG: hypothetical protein ACLPHP_06115 [Candidatus Sulfotelmatobacter sp.]